MQVKPGVHAMLSTLPCLLHTRVGVHGASYQHSFQSMRSLLLRAM